MRITDYDIDDDAQKEIEKITLQTGGFNDKMVATDFSKDMYALFADNPQVVKGTWSIFSSLRKMFVKWKIANLSESIDFYLDIKKFMREFSQGEFYRQLKQLPPLEALDTFLGLFKKPPSPQQCQTPGQQGQGQGDKQQDKKDGEQEGDKDSQQDIYNKDNLPVDLDRTRGQLKKINKVARAGLYSDEQMRDLAQRLIRGAGNEIRDLQIDNTNIDIITSIADKLGNRNLTIFEIARTKEIIDSYKVGSTYHRSDFPDNELDISKIKKITDYYKILPTQLALDDDVFYMRLANNDLLIKEYLRKKRRKQALYLLIDVSGSMAGVRSAYASGTALSLVRQALANEAIYFLRFFDASPSQLYRVQNHEEAAKISELLIKEPFSGGGTNITGAVLTAVKDIKNNKVKFDKVEIMLISDGEDYVGFSKSDLGEIKLHSTIIAGGNNSLQRVSETYTLLHPGQIQKQFALDNFDFSN